MQYTGDVSQDFTLETQTSNYMQIRRKQEDQQNWPEGPQWESK